MSEVDTLDVQIQIHKLAQMDSRIVNFLGELKDRMASIESKQKQIINALEGIKNETRNDKPQESITRS